MGLSLQEILHPKRILGVFSQVNPATTMLSEIFGWGPGGSNVLPHGGRDYNFDLFDNTRKIPNGRVPGAQRGTRRPQIVGRTQGIFPRAAEEIPLDYERMLNLRQIGGPIDENNLSAAAESYITKQEIYLGQIFANMVEFQTAAMLRGKYSYTIDGDDLIQTYGGDGDYVIDFQVPSGNKAQLAMTTASGTIIDASWATAGTNIPLHLFKIDAAMQELTGDRLSRVLVGAEVWNYIVNNDYVKAQAGSANAPVENINQLAPADYAGMIRSLPWVKFHIVNAGLNSSSTGTFETLIADDHASFIPEPRADWTQYVQGSEVVVENDTKTTENRMGTYAWSFKSDNPAGHNLAAVHNGIPVLYRPNNIVDGEVVFT